MDVSLPEAEAVVVVVVVVVLALAVVVVVVVIVVVVVVVAVVVAAVVLCCVVAVAGVHTTGVLGVLPCREGCLAVSSDKMSKKCADFATLCCEGSTDCLQPLHTGCNHGARHAGGGARG